MENAIFKLLFSKSTFCMRKIFICAVLALSLLHQSPAQKRDILFNNAARFLRLTPEQIEAMH
jgi:predicted TIM-barrel fold metal-dependent hydrolase